MGKGREWKGQCDIDVGTIRYQYLDWISHPSCPCSPNSSTGLGRLFLVLLIAFGFVHLVCSAPFLPSSPGRSPPPHDVYPTSQLSGQGNPDLQRSVHRFTRSCSGKSPHTPHQSIVNRVFGFGIRGGEKGPEP